MVPKGGKSTKGGIGLKFAGGKPQKWAQYRSRRGVCKTMGREATDSGGFYAQGEVRP